MKRALLNEAFSLEKVKRREESLLASVKERGIASPLSEM
jgi:hypothetical protein